MVTDAGWLYEGSPRLSMPDLMFHYRAASFFGNVNAPDVPRHYLNGVLIEFGQGRLTCIATNGHMIGISTASAEIEIAAKVQRISSTQAAKQLLNILKCGELVEVTNSENALQFRCGTTKLSIKPIRHKYPDWNLHTEPHSLSPHSCTPAENAIDQSAASNLQ